MKHLKTVLMLVVMAVVLGACASGPGQTGWQDEWQNCAMVGLAAGGGAGAIDDKSSSVAVGVVAGAVIGGLICGMMDTDADGVKNFSDKCPGTVDGGIVDERGCEKDSDGDGVVDRLDECPGTPQGARVDSRGCEPDSDGDGVIDRLDNCPGTPAGAVVDSHGCELDGDNDGVVDRLDKCPNTPAGVAVDNNGCTLAQEFKLDGVNFEFDSAKLTGDSNAKLDDIVKIMNRHSSLKVEIAGHTDSQGPEDYNLGLSQRRAQSVANYLSAHGVDAGRMKAKGYGESQPVADNSTEAGRAANRRVELRQK